jgi:hypothetical protein
MTARTFVNISVDFPSISQVESAVSVSTRIRLTKAFC